jgi:hypothetical protein
MRLLPRRKERQEIFVDFRFVIGFARPHYRFGSAAGNLTAKTPRTPRERKAVAVAG